VLDLLRYQQVNPASTLSEQGEVVCRCVFVCVRDREKEKVRLYWRQLRIGSISVMTLVEHQHLVLKVIQSPRKEHTNCGNSFIRLQIERCFVVLIKTETCEATR